MCCVVCLEGEGREGEGGGKGEAVGKGARYTFERKGTLSGSLPLTACHVP